MSENLGKSDIFLEFEAARMLLCWTWCDSFTSLGLQTLLELSKKSIAEIISLKRLSIVNVEMKTTSSNEKAFLFFAL